MPSLIDITPAHPLGQEHAADHQGHEDGLGGEAAARAGSRARGAAVRANHAADAGATSRRPRPKIRMRRTNPLLARRDEKRIQLLVVTADRGLAGAFNSNVIKAAQKFIAEHRDAEVQLELIGRKGARFFPQAARRTSPANTQRCFRRRSALRGRAGDRAQGDRPMFSKAEIDAVYLVVNNFQDRGGAELVLTRILPVELPENAGTDRLYLRAAARRDC